LFATHSKRRNISGAMPAKMKTHKKHLKQYVFIFRLLQEQEEREGEITG
jgi:hypothetical protein